MKEEAIWQIPPSMKRWLTAIPLDRPVALLLRHSVRDDLPPGDAGNTVPINEAGVELGKLLGHALRGRLRTLHASPLPRCIQTAEVIRSSAGVERPIVPDLLLGDPGVFVLDGRTAWGNWVALGHEGVMQHLVSGANSLPGMANPDAAARHLVHHMLASAAQTPGLHVFVTHDSLVTATAARLLGKALGPESWPWYLEGAFFWRDDEGLQAAYRDEHRVGVPEPLCGLREMDVIEFARREVARTVGLDSGARFFLAGGAFKSLLTGRPPRDLDLWATSVEDRNLLVEALNRRGAHRLPARPFADAFEIAGRIVEVPHKTSPSTLEGRLAHFDLALSAIGAEHRPDDDWSASIHDLARASVERRTVLLLKPLINWKYALTTLERMRRYAAELGFASCVEDEAEVWNVFESQSDELRAGMLARYAETSMGGFNVPEEIEARSAKKRIGKRL